METWKLSVKVSELSDVIPYYFFSLVSSCLSLSTVLVIFSEGSNWGLPGIIVFSFYVVIPYLFFAVPVQVLFNKYPNKFNLVYLYLYVFFSLVAVFIYSSVLNFDFSMEVLTTKDYYAMSLSAALIFWFWDSVFLQKKRSAS
ncbi:UPF0715 family protein [Peribacillus sp. ACCC06369]|uniref:UPF0715 family protein n=1 Tax=Peribacillus sp. ACCC06369 TaxID=3055860 RepID=UPI0025A143D7|nr:UPF0715 family protein [Peribacillus sp. ACCC06369]MDM5360281.1 UPF0715 family protein [Peribacillus sp. ACCC06369]